MLNWHYFLHYFRLSCPSKGKDNWSRFIWVQCPFYHATNSVVVLNTNNTAVMICLSYMNTVMFLLTVTKLSKIINFS